MTVAIASYQRRGPLLRLLRGLDQQFAADEDLRLDVEVVVVLDGSTDGSREAVESAAWSVPVRVIWQANRGLAAARNVGLNAAQGRIVWFLDDDLVPSSGLVARHRSAHRSDGEAVVVGPCRIPPDTRAPAPLVEWWDTFYEELGAAGVIDRFDRFTTANASAPASVFTAVGGFDETFVAYGLEDYELAVRLLGAGVVLRFDAEAVAWHPDIPPKSVLIARERGIGRNSALLARLHPALIDSVFAPGEDSKPARILRTLRVRRPKALMAVSRAAFGLYALTSGVQPSIARRAEHLSRKAARVAGVAECDPDGALVRRALGYDGRAAPPG